MKKINIRAPIMFDEPMAKHTSFRIGGPADLFVSPLTEGDLVQVLSQCFSRELPFFTLGEGANILVSDRGIDGIVIDMSRLNGIEVDGPSIRAMAGTPLSRVAETAAEIGLAGLETFYTMPGSVGGSVWMNARCYGVSLSEVLDFVDIVDIDLQPKRLRASGEQFDYKKSPFQSMKAVIVAAGFRLEPGNGPLLYSKMAEYNKDRQRKGHFLYPSAGSIFKNNPSLGMPSGKIIDSLNLRGFAYRGASISEAHANIIINTGSATGRDVKTLIDIVKERVKEAYGFALEEEILYVGRWEENHEQ